MPQSRNRRGAAGPKRKGKAEHGRAALSNGVSFDSRVDARQRLPRRIKTLMSDYAAAMQHTASPIEIDMLRSAGLLQVTIDGLEHAAAGGGKLDWPKYRTALNTRDMLLRRCGVLAADWHHPDTVTEGTALVRDTEGEL